MKRKLLLLLSFGMCMCSEINAQNTNTLPTTNTYRIEVQGITDANLPQATSLLTQFTSPEIIRYNSLDNIFTLSTSKELDKNVISGKMQKNFFPITMFQKAGEIDSTFPQLKNTGNPEADATTYDTEKAEWIRQNPEEYQKMLNNPSTASSPK